MKRILLILTIISLVFRTAAQQEEILHYPGRLYDKGDTIIDPFSLKKEFTTKGEESRLDSIYESDWSTGITDWILVFSSHHTYNIDHTRDYTIHRVRNGGSWLNYSAQFYTYDVNGNREKEVVKAWSEGEQEWLNYSQYLFSYNDFNNLTHYIYQKWNSTFEVWDNSAKYIYDYDAEQNWIYYERQDWNKDSLRWELNYRFFYTYENGLKTEMLRQNYNKTDSIWVNDTKNVYSYDASDYLIEEIQYVWQSGSSTWVNSTRITFIRDQSGQVTEKIYQAWITGEWKYTSKYTYQYEFPGKESEIVYYIWGGAAWNINYRYLYDYNEAGVLIRETDQKWQTGKGSWENDYKWEYYSSWFYYPLQVDITDSVNVTCYGYSDGSATATPSGGTPPYSYSWDDEAGTTDSTVYGLAANRYYTVTVTDADMNSVKDSVILSEPDSLHTYFSDSTNISCNGYSDGSAVVSVSGGTSPYSYQWDDESSCTDSVVTGLMANIWYSVLVTDSNQCEKKDSIMLSQPDPLTAFFSDSSNVSCNGYSDGSAVISVSGGTPPYTYQWDDGGSCTDSVVTGLMANIWYHVLVTDSNQCEKEDSIILTQPDPLSTSFSDIGNVSCYGYSDGWVSVSVAGGTPPYTYLWDDEMQTTDSVVYGLVADVWYHILVTDSNQCWEIDSVMLSQPPEILTGPIYGDTQVNQYDTVTYWVESDPASTYSWTVTSGTVYFDEGVDSIIVIWTQSGQGRITVEETTLNGCTGEAVDTYVSVSPTGINDNEIPVFHIAPNPAKQYVTINTSFSSSVVWDLQIYDITGKSTVQFSSVQGKSLSVYVGDWRKGVYFFRISCGKGVTIRKVIVE